MVKQSWIEDQVRQLEAVLICQKYKLGRGVMGAASRYWRLVGINGTKEIKSARDFFQRQFPELVTQTDLPDGYIQERLVHWYCKDSAATKDDSLRSEECLRCYISGQIKQVCLQLEAQFGAKHGFTYNDLSAIVLNDTASRRPPTQTTSAIETTSQSLATQILQTFDLERRSLLSTWVTRLVKTHQELNAFLLQHGVYMVSDWAILNDTTPKQLERIFGEFHSLTPMEIKLSSQLLESYHAIYRRDRLQQRLQKGKTGTKGKCSPPTPEQLRQIAMLFQGNQRVSTRDILTQLQEVAERLRQYRIYIRGGSVTTESLETLETLRNVEHLSSPEPDSDEDEAREFLDFYREQLLASLDEALEQVTNARLSQFQRKPQKAQQFLRALHLFHCKNVAMGEISTRLGMSGQHQVSRLLNLKALRADISQTMLILLRDRILDQARFYAAPSSLQNLEERIKNLLDEQISTIIQEAETEASTVHRSTRSQLSQRLCRHLDTRGIHHD